MYTNRQSLWNEAPTPTARLCCVRRIHGDNLDTSFFRFVFKHLSGTVRTLRHARTRKDVYFGS